MTDNIKQQILKLAEAGAIVAHDDIDLDEDDYRTFEEYNTAKKALYNALPEDEKRRWFNLVLTLLNSNFNEDDLPYIRSSVHGKGFVDAVRFEARSNFPVVYAAIIFAEQKVTLENKIRYLLNEENWS